MDKWSHIPRVDHPPDTDISVRLFTHQLASVWEMERIEATSVFDAKQESEMHACALRSEGMVVENSELRACLGINGNITGFGKTLEMITLIYRNNIPWDLDKLFTTQIPHGSTMLSSSVSYVSAKRTNSTLVLVSASIMKQWESELALFPLSVQVVCTVTHISKLQKQFQEDRKKMPDVVLVTWKKFNQLCSAMNVAWKRFIFDEPPHSRVPKMQRVLAGRHWLVTATPRQIPTVYQYGVPYMTAVRRNIYNEECFAAAFAPVTVRLPDDFVRESFTLPQTTYLNYQCIDRMTQMFAGLVPAGINDVLASGDVEAALKCLGVQVTASIADAVIAQKESELRSALSDLEYIERFGRGSSRTARQRERVEAAQSSLKSARDRVTTLLESECPICRDTLDQPVIDMVCQNAFCRACLFSWLEKSKSCPMCRTQIKINDVVCLTDTKRSSSQSPSQSTAADVDCSSSSNATAIEQKSKRMKLSTMQGTASRAVTLLRVVSSAIERNPEAKIVVFSKRDYTADTIGSALQQIGENVMSLNGSAATRARILRDFRNGKFRVLFLNSSVDSAGLNLQFATDLVFYQNLNENKTQLVGRANRIGRALPLTVHLFS